LDRSVGELVGQRVHALALGYENLNDREALCRDLLSVPLVGKKGPTGQRRKQEAHRGQPPLGRAIHPSRRRCRAIVSHPAGFL